RSTIELRPRYLLVISTTYMLFYCAQVEAIWYQFGGTKSPTHNTRGRALIKRCSRETKRALRGPRSMVSPRRRDGNEVNRREATPSEKPFLATNSQIAKGVDLSDPTRRDHGGAFAFLDDRRT